MGLARKCDVIALDDLRILGPALDDGWIYMIVEIINYENITNVKLNDNRIL